MTFRFVRFICVIALFFLIADCSFAQEAATDAGEHAPTKSWLDLFLTTGIVGILLLLTSITGTGLLIQYLFTYTEPKMAPPELLEEIDGMLTQGNYEEAMARLETDTSYAARVMGGALNRSHGGYDEAVKGLEEVSAVEGFRVTAKLSLLSLVGNIGPLLGLLGTVTGMIASFQEIERLKAPTPGDLAKGVYESLVNTTIGLFIAIVFLSAFFFMKNKVTDITLRINNTISDILLRSFAQTEKS